MHIRGTCTCLILLVAAALATTTRPTATAGEEPLEAVTFAIEPGELFVPVAEAARRLGWKLEPDEQGGGTVLNGTVLPPESFRVLPAPEGQTVAPLSVLEQAGAEVTGGTAPEEGAVGHRDMRSATVRFRQHVFTVMPGARSVEIDLADQRLRARQGKLPVLETRISSGRWNSTPRGDFRAGPYKRKRHFSSRYDNAPMPWSVQVTGHIFIHGFTSVPDYPASHGCIRLPLDGDNPARFFYEWIEVGTPIRIR